MTQSWRHDVKRSALKYSWPSIWTVTVRARNKEIYLWYAMRIESHSHSNSAKILLLVIQTPPSRAWTEIAPNPRGARSIERHVWSSPAADHRIESASTSVFTVSRQEAQRCQLSEWATWPGWNGQQVGLGRETTDGVVFCFSRKTSTRHGNWSHPTRRGIFWYWLKE